MAFHLYIKTWDQIYLEQTSFIKEVIDMTINIKTLLVGAFYTVPVIKAN